MKILRAFLAAAPIALFCGGLFAQKPSPPDTAALKTVLALANSDTARMAALDKLGRAFSRTDPSRAVGYLLRLDSLAKRARNGHFEARAASQMSYFHGIEGRNEQAILLGKRAIHLYDSLDDRRAMRISTENLSVFLIRDGNFKEAHAINLRLLDEQEKAADHEGLFHTHQRIATIYSEQKQKTEALRHNRASLAEAALCNSKYLTATALGSIADVLSLWPDSAAVAEDFYKKSISLYEKADTCPSCIAQYSATLAGFYLRLGREAETGRIVEKGLAAAAKTEDPYAKFAIDMAAAQLAIVQHRPEAAAAFLRRSAGFSQITSATEVDFEKIWAQYFFAVGQPERGFERLQKAFALQDSVAAEVYDEGVSRLQVEYETEKKEHEAALLATKNRALQVQNDYTLAVALLLGLGLLGVVYSATRLRRQKRLIQAQNESLERLNATKDRFFAIIAHDLRGPIVSFHGLIKKINWLIERGQADRVSQLANSVDEAAAGLNKLLDNLLTWALVQRGTMPYHPEQIRLREEAELGVAAFKNALDAKNIDLEMDIDAEIEVFADRAALACFVRNLTDNALKYTPEGSRINISASPADGGVRLSVADNGPGMDEAQVERLLSEKSPDSAAPAAKGTGLGLMLCRELAELNRGKLAVSSRRGEGTTISIWLPRAA